mmetsp:Transcript_12823/g.24066  ORF Transcript_12823/g.24066 Transcript_12823/m.24066 type:complete len:113 (+) Transcript_12823:6084-6422(+)
MLLLVLLLLLGLLQQNLLDVLLLLILLLESLTLLVLLSLRPTTLSTVVLFYLVPMLSPVSLFISGRALLALYRFEVTEAECLNFFEKCFSASHKLDDSPFHLSLMQQMSATK